MTSRQGAFSLLESLIAVSILGVTASTVMMPIVAGVQNDAEDVR